jgi:type II secretory pathway pseudopilin PulG
MLKEKVPVELSGRSASFMKLFSKTCNSRIPGAFTMVEVLLGLAVLSIMFVSLYGGFSGGFAVVQLSRENMRGTQILQEKMETIRLYTWDQINTPGFIPTNFVEYFYASSTNNALNGRSYTGVVTIAAAPMTTETYSNDLKQVNIRVTWVSAGAVRRREMSTFISHYGLHNYIY